MQWSGDGTVSNRVLSDLVATTIVDAVSDRRAVTEICRSALRVLSFCLVVIATGATVSAEEQDAVGQVIQQQGVVTARREAVPRPLYVGAAVYTGDRIVTAAEARVEIEFRDGSTLSIGSGTDVEVMDYSPGARKSGRLTLLIGILRTSLSDLWTDGFDVWTRAAIASVRSTDWVTEAREDRSSVFVVSGEVEVAAVADGTRVRLSAGQGTDVEIGGAPSPPKRWGSARIEDVLARTRLP